MSCGDGQCCCERNAPRTSPPCGECDCCNPRCDTCGAPATCLGSYNDSEDPPTFACDACCIHHDCIEVGVFGEEADESLSNVERLFLSQHPDVAEESPPLTRQHETSAHAAQKRTADAVTPAAQPHADRSAAGRP